MINTLWQLDNPVSAIVFDCDGTLSFIEGINELARYKGVADEVESLTSLAMGKTGMNPDLYQQRLQLVNPNQDQVLTLGKTYFEHRVPDVTKVVQILHRLNKSLYIMSAGLYPAVKIFAEQLQIPEKNIFAVDIEFDQMGNYKNHDHSSPLIHNDGKRIIVEQLKQSHQRIIHIGDGLNDYVTHDIVTRFIGYGGAFYRENIAACCEFYIKSASMSALLPLSLTLNEYQTLNPNERDIYTKGLASLNITK